MVGTDQKKRRRVMAAAAAIPDDLLIAEVLVHLPARSIARCRCVCRSWRAGIATAAFVRRHRDLSRARPPSSVLDIPREIDFDDYIGTTTEIAFHRFLPLQQLPPPTPASELVFEKAWPEGITRAVRPMHCDGLVAVATTTDRVFVCNPATREFVALPLGTHNVEVDHYECLLAPPVALGFDRWRNRYVVARYLYRKLCDDTGKWSKDYDIGHEVFTLGSGDGGSWELTEDPPLSVGFQRPTCTRQAFYWHSWSPTPRLLRFGLQDRAFQVVPRPLTADWGPLDDMTDFDDGRKLCFLHAATEAEFNVWMADDRPDLLWQLRCRVHLPEPVPKPNLTYITWPVLVAGDGDTLVTCVGNTLYRCSLRGGKMVQVVDMERQLGLEPYTMQSVVPYFETLVSITACNY